MTVLVIKGNRVEQDGQSVGLMKIQASGIYYRGELLVGAWVQVLTRDSERRWYSLDGLRVLWGSAVDGYQIDPERGW